MKYDPRRRMRFSSSQSNIWQRVKSVGTVGAWLFVIAHIFIWGGAVAYVSHLAGFEVPFLGHDHGCDCGG